MRLTNHFRIQLILAVVVFSAAWAIPAFAQTDVHVNGNVPSRVSPNNSSFKADRGSLLADGIEKVTLTATVVDIDEAPLAQKLVTVTSSRGQAVDSIRCYLGIVLTYHNYSYTDEAGRVVCEVTSNTDGVAIFTAVAEGITLDDKPTVTFKPVTQPPGVIVPQPPTPTPTTPTTPPGVPTVVPPAPKPPSAINRIIDKLGQILNQIPPIIPGIVGLGVLIPTIMFLVPLGSGISSSVMAGIPALQYLLFSAFPSLRSPRRWGRVRDLATKVPIPGIFVNLVNVERQQVVRRVMTDRTGRFGFLNPADRMYRIEIHNPLYQEFISEPFDTAQFRDKPITFDIDLAALEAARVEALRKTVRYMRFLTVIQFIQFLSLIGGSILAVGMFISSQSSENVLLMSVYALLWVLHFISSLSYTQSGHIIELKEDNAVNEAVIQVTSLKKGQQQFVHSTVSDESGRFLVLVPPGQYTVFAAKEGYNPAEKIVSGEIQNIEMNLERLEEPDPATAKLAEEVTPAQASVVVPASPQPPTSTKSSNAGKSSPAQ